MIKPDVVLYEEGLDTRIIQNSVEAIAGSGYADHRTAPRLVVYPAAGFIDYFRGKYLVLINKAETGRSVQADLVIREPIGQVMAQITCNPGENSLK